VIRKRFEQKNRTPVYRLTAEERLREVESDFFALITINDLPVQNAVRKA
jgi:hypothetical protein